MRHVSLPARTPTLRVTAVGLCLVLLFGLGAELFRGEQQSKQGLIDRFGIRVEVGSEFLASYVKDLVTREQEEAAGELRSAHVSQRQFARFADVFGFPAAVLLNARGELMAVVPSAPGRLGREIATNYPHLMGAVEGRISVSNVVSSAARSVPVVAFAVPFAGPSGRRVFSGALILSQTTLGSSYLKSLVPIEGSRAYLVDETGATITSSLSGRQTSGLMQQHDPSLLSAIGSAQVGHLDSPGGAEQFVVAPVAGTPWRLVAIVPERGLLAPVSGTGRWVPRLSLIALLLAIGAVVTLLRRLTKTRIRQLDELERLSVTDALTGLYNRRGHELLASQVLRSGLRDNSSVAVLFMDIDDLKRVNDEQGHEAGDRMLRGAAQLLRETFRDSDVIARLGGDEFCVVGAAPGSLAERAAIRSRLEENLARRNATRDDQPSLSISVGITWSDPQHPRSLEDLVREADTRMYEDKRSQRAQQVISSMGERLPI